MLGGVSMFQEVVFVRHGFLSSVAAAGMAATVVLWTSAGAAAAPPDARTYVALGDSLSVGIGATDPARLGYVAHVFRAAHASPAGSIDHLVNLAVSGETSRTFITGGQLERSVAAIGDPSSDVRLVTLNIGGNDLLGLLQSGQPCAVDPSTLQCQAAVRAALSAFPAYYATILTRLTQALAADPGDEQLLVVTYYNPFIGTGNLLFERAVDAALLGSDRRIHCSAVPGA